METGRELAQLERHLAARGQQGSVYATRLLSWLRECDSTAERRELVADLTYRMQQSGTGRPGTSLTAMQALLAEWRHGRTGYTPTTP